MAHSGTRTTIPSRSSSLRSAINISDLPNDILPPPIPPKLPRNFNITSNPRNTTSTTTTTTSTSSNDSKEPSTVPTHEQKALAVDYQQALSTMHKLEFQLELADAEFDRAAIRLLYLKAEALEAARRVTMLDEKIKEDVEWRMKGCKISMDKA